MFTFSFLATIILSCNLSLFPVHSTQTWFVHHNLHQASPDNNSTCKGNYHIVFKLGLHVIQISSLEETTGQIHLILCQGNHAIFAKDIFFSCPDHLGASNWRPVSAVPVPPPSHQKKKMFRNKSPLQYFQICSLTVTPFSRFHPVLKEYFFLQLKLILISKYYW